MQFDNSFILIGFLIHFSCKVNKDNVELLIKETEFKCYRMDIRTKVKRSIKVQKNGIHNDERDRVYIGSKHFQSEEHLKKEFLNCKERLLHVSGWSSITGGRNGSFWMYGIDGKPLATIYPTVGNFIRVKFSELFPVFWMRIDSVLEDDGAAEVITSPAADPTGKEKRKPGSTNLSEAHSIFRVEKLDNSVIAAVINVIDFPGDHEDSSNDWNLFLDRPWKSLTDYVIGNSTS